jgi:ATP-binding cassette subfamily F protein 3
VLDASGLVKSYGPNLVWTDVEVSVTRGERLLVLGLNGAGKTTLLRILAGAEPHDGGEMVWGTGVSVGYYAQEHEGIDPAATALDHVHGGALGTETERRAVLGAFGLTGDAVFQAARTLSGGEKTKLALAQLVAGRHNLLLLDEPTNNLDPASRLAVSAALRDWPGTIVMVSHDAEFVEALEPDRALLLPDGVLDSWHADLLELVPLA